MKPVLIQHLISQLKKTQPKKHVEDTPPPPSSMIPTVFVLVLAVVILVIALK